MAAADGVALPSWPAASPRAAAAPNPRALLREKMSRFHYLFLRSEGPPKLALYRNVTTG